MGAHSSKDAVDFLASCPVASPVPPGLLSTTRRPPEPPLLPRSPPTQDARRLRSAAARGDAEAVRAILCLSALQPDNERQPPCTGGRNSPKSSPAPAPASAAGAAGAGGASESDAEARRKAAVASLANAPEWVRDGNGSRETSDATPHDPTSSQPGGRPRSSPCGSREQHTSLPPSARPPLCRRSKAAPPSTSPPPPAVQPPCPLSCGPGRTPAAPTQRGRPRSTSRRPRAARTAPRCSSRLGRTFAQWTRRAGGGQTRGRCGVVFLAGLFPCGGPSAFSLCVCCAGDVRAPPETRLRHRRRSATRPCTAPPPPTAAAPAPWLACSWTKAPPSTPPTRRVKRGRIAHAVPHSAPGETPMVASSPP